MNRPPMAALYVMCLAVVAIVASSAAHAVCTISNISFSPTSANAGTYTIPTAPTAQGISIVISFTTAGNGNCQFGVAFRRASLPAVMTRVGGGTLPYTIRTQATGGTTLLFTGANPASNFFPILVNTGDTSSGPHSVFFLEQPIGPVPSGNYTDSNLILEIYNRNGSNLTGPALRSVPFTVNGTVASGCSISNPINVSQVISVGPTGLTTGMATGPPNVGVSCTGPSNVALISQNGAVTLGGVLETTLTAVPSFRNKIEYGASTNGGAGAVSLNTATANSASGVFNTAAITSGTTVTIAPQASAVPLEAGTYSDTLILRITPQ